MLRMQACSLLLFLCALNSAGAFVPQNHAIFFRTRSSGTHHAATTAYSPGRALHALHTKHSIFDDERKGRYTPPGSVLSLKATSSKETGSALNAPGLGGPADQVNGDWDRPGFLRGFVSAKEDGWYILLLHFKHAPHTRDSVHRIACRYPKETHTTRRTHHIHSSPHDRNLCVRGGTPGIQRANAKRKLLMRPCTCTAKFTLFLLTVLVTGIY
jgi:hypothetical protein